MFHHSFNEHAMILKWVTKLQNVVAQCCKISKFYMPFLCITRGKRLPLLRYIWLKMIGSIFCARINKFVQNSQMCKAMFSVFNNILQQNIAILLVFYIELSGGQPQMFCSNYAAQVEQMFPSFVVNKQLCSKNVIDVGFI